MKGDVKEAVGNTDLQLRGQRHKCMCVSLMTRPCDLGPLSNAVIRPPPSWKRWPEELTYRIEGGGPGVTVNVLELQKNVPTKKAEKEQPKKQEENQESVLHRKSPCHHQYYES